MPYQYLYCGSHWNEASQHLLHSLHPSHRDGSENDTSQTLPYSVEVWHSNILGGQIIVGDFPYLDDKN